MKILILTNNDVGLYKFRKELLQALLDQGNQVFISLPPGEFKDALTEMGCIFLDTYIDRRGINPVTDTKLIFHYIKLLTKIKPDIILTYTIKPNIYGGLVCRLFKIPYLTTITGLGTAVEGGGHLGKILVLLYKVALKKAKCVFFENDSNQAFLEKNGAISGKSKLVPGSGVNIRDHSFKEYPKDDGTIRLLFVGRVMKDKGIEELAAAIKIIDSLQCPIKFDIVGPMEEQYDKLISELDQSGHIKYHGLQNDVDAFIENSHVTILPSYHEGMSNVLLESASCGRPVLASNVPGCRETFAEGISGFGFKAKDVDDLVETIIKFAELPYERKKEMGLAGRKKMESEYDRKIVIDAYIEEICS